MFRKMFDKIKEAFKLVRLPKITLPKFKLPKLSLPEFKLPKVSLPKLVFPKINLSPLVNAISGLRNNWRILLITLVVVSAVGAAGYAVGERQLELSDLGFSSRNLVQEFEVTGNKLNIRPCPGKDCQAIGSIHRGDIVSVTDRVISTSGDEWCKIDYKNVDAYVSCNYLVEVKKGE